MVRSLTAENPDWLRSHSRSSVKGSASTTRSAVTSLRLRPLWKVRRTEPLGLVFSATSLLPYCTVPAGSWAIMRDTIWSLPPCTVYFSSAPLSGSRLFWPFQPSR
jgi:hypothetical protein